MWRARRANLPNSRLCYRGRLRSKGGSGFAEIGRKLISAEVASLATAVADIALISTTWSVVVGATGGPHTNIINELSKSEGQNTPLTPNGYFERHPHRCFWISGDEP